MTYTCRHRGATNTQVRIGARNQRCSQIAGEWVPPVRKALILDRQSKRFDPARTGLIIIRANKVMSVSCSNSRSSSANWGDVAGPRRCFTSRQGQPAISKFKGDDMPSPHDALPFPMSNLENSTATGLALSYSLEIRPCRISVRNVSGEPDCFEADRLPSTAQAGGQQRRFTFHADGLRTVTGNRGSSRVGYQRSIF